MTPDQDLLPELQQAIESDRILLPTLPEVALRVRDAVERESATVRQVADIVATDAALSARLLQVANSPLYRGRVPIDNLQMAITRLGTRLVRSLVVSLAMRQMFQATSPGLDHAFRQTWERSVEVAGIARMLSKTQAQLDPEQALLAGLIHDIGALPVLTLLEQKGMDLDNRTFDFLLTELSPAVGGMILKKWDFPAPLVAVAENFHNFAYQGGPEADYVDLVIVARLQSLSGSSHPDAALDWNDIQSFAKLGLGPEIEVVEMEGAAEEISEVKQMFS